MIVTGLRSGGFPYTFGPVAVSDVCEGDGKG